jgi:hypothetical protein
MWPARAARAETVKLLLDNGADPNGVFRRRGIIDFESRTGLIAAMPLFGVMSILLQAGANPNLPSTWDEEPDDGNLAAGPPAGQPRFAAVAETLWRELRIDVGSMDRQWMQDRREVTETHMRA